jgi:Domain of unknown function (DUF3127)
MIEAELIKKFNTEEFTVKNESKKKISFLIKTKDDFPREIYVTAFSKMVNVIESTDIGSVCEWDLIIKSTHSDKNDRYYTDISLKYVKK